MRHMVSATAFLVGLGLLASAYLTATASPATEERILRLDVNSTDIRFLDPALNYDFIGWRLEFATCARLLSYPDKPGRRRAHASIPRSPKASRGLDGGKRTRSRSGRASASRTAGRHGGELRARHRAGAQPADAVARGVVPRRPRRRRARARGQGADAVRSAACAATS